MDRSVCATINGSGRLRIFLGKSADSGRQGNDNQLFLETVLWIAPTRSPWRGLTVDFGKWARCSRVFGIGYNAFFQKDKC